MVDENSLSSGPSWISFQWQASTETCRKKIGSYLVSENLPDRPFFSCPTGSSDTVTFNTSLDCFKQNIYSCGDYSLSVSFEMDGKVVGKPTVVNRTTLFDDLIPFIYPNSSHGLDWFSFQWELSDHNCTKYISSYSLNVTEFFNKTEEIRSLNITDCLEPATQDLFVFNSSCPNANLSIVRCSSYMVTVLPSLSINNELLKSSPSPFSELETSSGNSH